MSIIRRLAFHVTILIYVRGHVIVLGVRGDTVDEVIRDPGLALAGFVDTGGSSNEFLGFLNEFMWINTENFC